MKVTNENRKKLDPRAEHNSVEHSWVGLELKDNSMAGDTGD